MNFPDVLPEIAAALQRASVPYMLSGSFAGAYYGWVRSTQDIDLIIDPSPSQLRAFVEDLAGKNYYADVEAALDALRLRSMFNVIDLKTGWKVDLIVRKNRPFSGQEFARRQKLTLGEFSFFVATAEDLIVAKLEWAKRSQSQRQLEDVAGIVRVRDNSLDFVYLEKWVVDLDLISQWQSARHMAGISPSSGFQPGFGS